MVNSKCKAIALVAACTFSILAAQASPITFSPGGDNSTGSLKCEVSIDSLGNLALKSGSASISGRVITIKAASAYIDSPRTVLIGSVLKTEANLTSDPPNITGLALFLMGDWQNQIDDGITKDMIFRKDGHLDCRILGIENDSLSVNINGIPQRIPLDSVLYIRSPRVFIFKIVLGRQQPLQKDTVIQAESTNSSFRPTATARTLSGSVIPPGDKKDDGLGGLMSKRGGEDESTGIGGTSSMPGLPGLNTLNRPSSAVHNQWDDSQDDWADANRFYTVHTRWGDQKLTLPPGILGY